MSIRQAWSGRWLPLAAAVLLAGCSPTSDAERAFERSRRQEQLRREQLRATLEGVTEETAALEMVKQWPAVEGEGNTEEWTRRQLQEAGGNALFPHWRAQRRGMGRYDVTFTYTLMNELGGIEKKGQAWRVDLVLKTVSEPREMGAAELGRRIGARPPRSKPALRGSDELTNDLPLLAE